MTEKGPEKKGWAEWLQSMGLTANQVRLVPLVALILFIGILFLNAGELFGIDSSARPSDPPPNATLVTGGLKGSEDELTLLQRSMAAELEEKLSMVQGAGQVKAMVTLEAGPTIEVVKNTATDQSTTTEKAADNSTRETQTTNTRQDHVFYRDGSAERPVVAKTSRPEVAGVLIVADGARDARIRARLLDAAMVALKVPANRIEVVPADGGS